MHRKNSLIDTILFVGIMLAVAVVIAVLIHRAPHHRFGLIAPAYAHDAAMAKSAEEALLFKFYSDWKRMPARYYSCCSQVDCHEVSVRRERGRWYFFDKAQGLWREIPEEVIESNAVDPRESPDGRNHVCYNGGYVFCAVLGSGQ